MCNTPSNTKHGVAIIIKNDSGQILLLKRGGESKSDNYLWENLRGSVEATNETPLEAIEREAQEELDITIKDVKLLYKDVFSDSNNAQWTIYVYEGKTDDAPTIQESTKCSEIKWFSIDHLPVKELASYTKTDFEKLGWIN